MVTSQDRGTTRPGTRTRVQSVGEPFKRSILQDSQSRSERAHAYEEKVSGVLNMVMQMLAGSPATVADAAAFIESGPAFASKMGDLAAHDVRVRKGIDFITAGTENPYAAVVLAALPLVSQIIRNHESDVAKPFVIRIPFTKRTFKPRIKIRLNVAFMRGLTTTPRQLIHRVFGNPETKAALINSGIEVALPDYQLARNDGHAT